MRITISYQTQQLPPPYAFAAVFNFEIGDQCRVNFQLEYLERDQLDEDEILAEGFSPDDNYQWEGQIGNNWNSVLKELNQIAYVSEPDDEHYIHVIIDDQEKGHPKDVQNSSILIQEMIQAAYEASGKESMLEIHIHIDRVNYELVWKFADRSFSTNGSPISWESGRSLMESIYSVDFEQVNPAKQPKGELSIFFDDSLWYSIKNDKLTSKIRKQLA